ncbi:MAG: DUF2877 domain-containing protein [Saccharofermentanales bacterium]|jgi:hypothetical protein
MNADPRGHACIIASDLRRTLLTRGAMSFDVHSVFRTSVNLIAEDETFITIASSDRDIMPMGLVIEEKPKPASYIHVDDVVDYGGDMALTIRRTGVTIDLFNARVWDPALRDHPPTTAAQRRASLAWIRERLRAIKPENGGVAPLIACSDDSATSSGRAPNMYCSFIGGDLEAFMTALGEDDYVKALECSRRLIGFGPGLTPSCDDFLAGVMLSLYDMYVRTGTRHDTIDRFLRSIAAYAKGATTLVSYHMLRHAAEGKASDAYIQLVHAVATGDVKKLARVGERALAIGATSGGDFMYGLYRAQTMLLDNAVPQDMASSK